MSDVKYPLTLSIGSLRIAKREVWSELCDLEGTPSSQLDLDYRRGLLECYEGIAEAAAKAEVANFIENHYQPDKEFTDAYLNEAIKDLEA